MTAPVLLSPAEYLRTSYSDHDREYVRGSVVFRSMPTYLHARVHAFIIALFFALRTSHRLYPAPELRCRLAPDLIRIPDLAVYADTEPPYDEPPTEPPLLVVEIISPDDRFVDVLAKCAEYAAWGVKHIWLIDPQRKTLAAWREGSLVTNAATLTLPGYPITLNAAELFA